MERQERDMIEELFGKLRHAERQSPPRDAGAEEFIRSQVASQPAAPYYMAQTILVQENALENAQHRIAELEQQLASRPAGGGGFLGGLFGGGRQQPPQQVPPRQAYGQPGYGQQGYGQPGYGQQGHAQAGPWAGRGGPMGGGMMGGGRGGGFLAGAAQTAMGVAGGMMLGSLLSDVFSSGEAQAGELANSVDQFAGGDQGGFGNDSYDAGADSEMDGGFEDDSF